MGARRGASRQSLYTAGSAGVPPRSARECRAKAGSPDRPALRGIPLSATRWRDGIVFGRLVRPGLWRTQDPFGPAPEQRRGPPLAHPIDVRLHGLVAPDGTRRRNRPGAEISWNDIAPNWLSSWAGHPFQIKRRWNLRRRAVCSRNARSQAAGPSDRAAGRPDCLMRENIGLPRNSGR